MPIIGIVCRYSITEEGNEINIIYTDIVKSIYKNGGIPIGISLNSNYKEVINMCDGIILEGGDDFVEYEYEAIKYIYEKDIPLLGICLGMQSMGIVFNGELIDIKNHKKRLNYAHSVLVSTSSKLYNILKNNIVKVNSRHKSVLKKTDLEICAVSQDNYIEAIEDRNKRFFIGIQWHPESMSYDDKQNNIFKYFIKECAKNK